MTYDQTRRFTPTQLADEFAPMAESPACLYGNHYALGTETSSSSNQDIQEDRKRVRVCCTFRLLCLLTENIWGMVVVSGCFCHFS